MGTAPVPKPKAKAPKPAQNAAGVVGDLICVRAAFTELHTVVTRNRKIEFENPTADRERVRSGSRDPVAYVGIRDTTNSIVGNEQDQVARQCIIRSS
jgi:hypothetical protein